MSIMDRILKRRQDKKVEADKVEAQPSETQVTPVVEPVVEPVVGKPVEGQEDRPVAVSELDPVSGDQGETKSVDEASKPEEDKIETIQIGDDEISSLRRHHYDETKNSFPRTYIVEKLFVAYMQSTDPTNPGRRPVKVKRVAEVRAVSLLHALNMLGWDDRNVSVAGIKEETDATLAVLVDGKDIGCRIPTPPSQDGVPFGLMGGNQKKDYVANVVRIAKQDGKVSEIMNNPKKPRVVSGWAFEPGKHINLKMDKAPKAPEKPDVPVAEVQPVSTEVVESPTLELPPVTVGVDEVVSKIAEEASVQV